MLFALALLPGLFAAQGVTSAAVQGTVVGGDGVPIAGATVHLTNAANGRKWAIVTGHDGRFLLEAVTVGSYRVEVRAVGFLPETRSGIVLALGQRLVMDFTLRPAAVELPPVTVSATRDPLLDPGRTGPAEIISRSTIVDLPNPGRNFVNLLLLSPQVVSSPQTNAVPTGGVAIAGQNRLYNSFQIDGGMHHDLFRGQLPGRQSLPRPLSFEALEELQVLAAPFDVRHGSFAGGLVNAVTRSGTNAVHGSLFSVLADGALVRRGDVGGPLGGFTTWQLAGTVGGPIVRDRAHYFVSVDLQNRVVHDPGPLISDTAGGADIARIGISYANAQRVRDILDTLYGLDPGTLGPVEWRLPAQDIFGKVSMQLGTSSHLEATYHYAHGNRQDFLQRNFGQYLLSSFAQQEPSTSHAARLIRTSLVGGRWTNELVLSYLGLEDECLPRAAFPEIRVLAPRLLLAGTPATCPPHTQRQDVLEIADNATFGFGRHVVTVGAHSQLLRFRDELVNGLPGTWIFNGPDSLEAGRARIYQRTLHGPAWAGGVDFRATQVALFAQDRWSATRKLTLTAGLRVDVPILLDAIQTYQPLRDSLGFDTGRLPSGNALWSPRLGINYDVGGNGRTFLRGGIGLFGGPAPYRWLSNAYRDDGTQEVFLDCRGTQAPPFTPLNQPTTCGAGPQPRLSFFDANVRLPQNWRVALGVDHRLPAGLVGTLDLLVTRGVHQLYVTDANLRPPSGISQGEANRPLYGAINPSNGQATAARVTGPFDAVIRMSNRSGDQSFSIAAQLRTRFGGPVHGSALYAYARAWDRMWLAHFPARALLEGTVLDGTLENRRLAPAFAEIRHRVQLLATLQLPYRANLHLLYSGASGRPFTYTVSGDANADGLGVTLRQDAVYVPRDRGDITMDGNGTAAGLGSAAQQDSAYALLDAFIGAMPCLREQRARIMPRNSCRNPWFGTLTARLTKSLPTVRGQSLELAADVYNLLNLMNSRWGLSRYHGLTFATDLLVLTGYDTANGRGFYAFPSPPPPRNFVENLASRWQMEVSVRYLF